MILKLTNLWNTIFSEKLETLYRDLALLLLRLGFGLTMALAHGWGKLLSFAEKSATFPDPLGVGNQLSMAMAVGAEVFASLLIVVGLATRFALLPLITTMLVALFLIHGDDPFKVREKALVYLIPYVAMLLAGPGRFSIDHIIKKKLATPNLP